jgi:hypothetical protein
MPRSKRDVMGLPPKESFPKCKCGAEGSIDAHACPYNTELYDDYAFECNCCEECVQQCGWDV